MVKFLMVQPRIQFAFWAASAHYWVILSFLLTRTPKSSHRAALNPFSAQPASGLGIVPIYVQDLAGGLDELHEICTGPLFQPVDCATQLGIVCKLVEGALNPTIQVANKDVKQCQSQ